MLSTGASSLASRSKVVRRTQRHKRDTMSAQLWPTQDPDPGSAVHLTVQVHRIPERSDWKWQLVDTRGLVFETGLPYASSMEARRAAYERLAELTPLVGTDAVPGRTETRHTHTIPTAHDRPAVRRICLEVNESRVKELCATTFAIFTNQKITIRSANCGSMVSSVSINPGKRNCVLVTEVLRGCGSGIYSESRNARDGVGSNTTENCLAMTFNHGLLKARTATVDRPRTDDIRQSRGTRRA